MFRNFVFTIIVVVLSCEVSNGQRITEQIYSSIEGGLPCFRRLNGTHQAGCSSPENGAVGVVHFVKDLNDALWLTQNATAGPYVAVVTTSFLHNIIEIFMSKPENIAGILLYDSPDDRASAFSLESKCPNEYSSGLDSTCSSANSKDPTWNEIGLDLIRRDILFSIFFLPESRSEEIKKVEDCYKRYNLDKANQNGAPLCSVQLHSFMFAAVDSSICMRRSTNSFLRQSKLCDPLGDNNVYYSLFPRVKEEESAKKPVVLVTARIDASSLFDGLTPGAASSVVGMVTLVTAASVLSKMIPENKSYDKNVLWTLFNGESFDYIGSQRVAYDLSRGEWPPGAPLKPEDVPLHIELGQVGGALLSHSNESNWPLKVFSSINSNNLDVVTDTVKELISNLEIYNMTLTLTSTNNLPPSSLHSFRRILKNVTESGAMTQLLITDHSENKFSNLFYNSALDSCDKIGFVYHNISIGEGGTFISTDDLISKGTMNSTEPQVKISLLATALARTLYQKVVGETYSGSIAASAHLVDEMLYCFLKSQSCRLLIAADYAQSGGGDDNLPERPAPLYVGVSSWASTAPVFVGHLLALLAGTAFSTERAQCDSATDANYSYYWLRGWNHTGVCMQTTMNFSQALSPAFIINDYDFASGEFSTWTESVWHQMWARVFVTSSGNGARIAAATGTVTTVLSVVVTIWIRSRTRRIFGQAATALTSTDAAAGILRSVNC